MSGSIGRCSPYLSIIIYFRNDNYSPNAIEKLNFSTQMLINQLHKSKIESEIIIVDWNSPDPNEPLIDELKITNNSKYVSITAYEVHNNIHSRYKGHENMGIQGEVASNVGIRRSRGKFVVVKASDVFYSADLIRFLAEKSLREDGVYRLDRIDVDYELPAPKEWEAAFKNNIIIRKSSEKNKIHVRSCGDFLLMSKKKWALIRGFPETNCVVNNGADGEALYASIGAGAKQIYLKGGICLYKLSHAAMFSSRIETRHLPRKDLLTNMLLGTGERNKAQTCLLIVIKVIFGILNLPTTKILNVKTRSVYRYYLIANLRRLFFGGGFLKSNEWGLSKLEIEKKIISLGDWDQRK